MNLRSFFLALLVVVSAQQACFAADKEFDAYWTKFKTALKTDDKNAIASMTKLPYMLANKNLNKQQFIQKYNVLFPASTKKCLQKEKPQGDKDAYMVFCGEEIFIFNKINGKYLFTEIGVND